MNQRGFHHNKLMISMLLGCCFSGLVNAVLAEDFVPPKGFSESRYIRYWNDSPFKVTPKPIVPKPVQQVKQTPHSFTLAGVVKKGDREVVYIQDSKSKQVFKADAEGENDQGVKLIRLDQQDDAYDYVATISHQGRTIKLSYDRQKLVAARSIQPPQKKIPNKVVQQTESALPNKMPQTNAESVAKPVPASPRNARSRTIFSPK